MLPKNDFAEYCRITPQTPGNIKPRLLPHFTHGAETGKINVCVGKKRAFILLHFFIEERVIQLFLYKIIYSFMCPFPFFMINRTSAVFIHTATIFIDPVYLTCMQ